MFSSNIWIKTQIVSLVSLQPVFISGFLPNECKAGWEGFLLCKTLLRYQVTAKESTWKKEDKLSSERAQQLDSDEQSQLTAPQS